MPGYKITDLTSLGALAADGPNDLVEVVDVSDTATAPADAGGSNKKITIHDLVLAANQQLTVPQDAAGLSVSGSVTTPSNTRDHLVKIAQSFSSLGVDGEENPYIPDTQVSLLRLEATFPADDPASLASFHKMVKLRTFVPDFGDTEMTTRMFIDAGANIYTTGAISCSGILGAPDDIENLSGYGNVKLQGSSLPGFNGDVLSVAGLGIGRAIFNAENHIAMNPGQGTLSLMHPTNPIRFSIHRTYVSDTQWSRGGLTFQGNELLLFTSSATDTRGALRFDVATSVAPLTTNNTTLGTTSLRWSTIFGTALTIGSGLTALTGASNASALTVAGGNLTGSNSTNAISLTQTWNTTGSPKAIFVNITNTASGSGARLLDLQTGGTSRFSVDASGAAAATALNLGASSASRSSFNVAAGAAPSAPVDGDIWFDGTDLFFRAGGVTKQIATV